MATLFARQFWALFVKNWIILLRHPFLNVLRCFILPVAYGIFLAVAQVFLSKPNNYGIGNPAAVSTLREQFDGSLSLYWVDSTNGTGFIKPQDIMSHIVDGFTFKQLQAVRQLGSPEDVPDACPSNFNLFSECFAALIFNTIPASANDPTPLNYTIRADGGLFHIDVVRHTSDYEKRILPLQWAVDSAIIELHTSQQVSTPLEWPFTQETNTEQFTEIRLSYIRGLRSLLVLALFICYIGIAYQLPGSFMGERALSLTSHLQSMGLLNSARITSWHVSLSLAYLPAWVIVAIIWHFRIFTGTSIWLILCIQLLMGLSLASWSLFVGAPFGKSPQLAAVSSTILSIAFAVLALVFSRASTGAAFVFTLLFPPGFYVFCVRAIAGWETHRIPTNALRGDPDNNLRILPLIIAALIATIVWPYLTILLEAWLYDARDHNKRSWFSRIFKRQKLNTDESTFSHSPDIAISIHNLHKSFNAPWWKFGKSDVTAIEDLSLQIPRFGIFVLLGSNGAGKSTALSVLAGLLGASGGSVRFEGGTARPPRGELGIVPQKNVLFPELTCYQTLRVWKAVKAVAADDDEGRIIQTLISCDLGHKIHAISSTLSGGQKRKLQLAIGLIGGSKILLVDECTSGVDPLSRRALWRTLNSVRHNHTVLLTTHFLDEADLLADQIAILASPGKLVAEGTPVALKSELGEGYTVQIKFSTDPPEEKEISSPSKLLERIRTLAPECHFSFPSPHSVSYHLRVKDSAIVANILSFLEAERATFRIDHYDVHGTSMEDVFLGLMRRHDTTGRLTDNHSAEDPEGKEDVDAPEIPQTTLPNVKLSLNSGQKSSFLSQAFTIFYKRTLIARRSWLTPLLTVLVSVLGSCVPLFFLSDRAQTCVKVFDVSPTIPLYYPLSPLQLSQVTSPGGSILQTPPNIIETLGNSTADLLLSNISDNATFVNSIRQNFRNYSSGGISVDFATGSSLVAWEATPPGSIGPTMLNLVTNLLYNNALNATRNNSTLSSTIFANYQQLPAIAGGTLNALKWTAFYAAAMSVYPAFFTLYISKERHSSIQAMQMSNGLSNPVGLWLGHLLFDSMLTTLLSSVIIIIFATASNQFHGLGLFWVVLILYGVASSLFAYCVALVTASPLAAFAALAGYQIIMFVLYVAGYLLTLTFAKTSQANGIITVIHFTLSILSPVASPIRASFVSVNLFSLLCDGNIITTSSISTIGRYGGPILYLIIYSFVLFAVLVLHDSGSIFPQRWIRNKWTARRNRTSDITDRNSIPSDVQAESEKVNQSGDSLQVQHISKHFKGLETKAVDDVTFGVSQDTILALLGPNGAGKTSTFNIIRGDLTPDAGDVFIDGTSITEHPQTARASLGVCPQFTAIDSQLTVREHLLIYGKLKGLRRGPELNANVEAVINSTALSAYADRLASKLSGGNQRKLSLAIALMGNPSVILIDEFSTGIDAKMKRDMWAVLRIVAVGKAVVITTHSMEEASALANKVGIISGKMLAVGSIEALTKRYPLYEVHMTCRTPEDIAKAQQLMATIPGSRKADDVATRFEVPLQDGNEQTLASLFKILSEQTDITEYAIEQITLESIFLKVIKENNVKEEDLRQSRKPLWWRCC